MTAITWGLSTLDKSATCLEFVPMIDPNLPGLATGVEPQPGEGQAALAAKKGMACPLDTIINVIHVGDCATTMAAWPDAFIDLVVTSPPYDALRSYHGFELDLHAVA